MTMLSNKSSPTLTRKLSIGLTFAIGLALGVFVALAIQSSSLRNCGRINGT